MIPKVIYYCWFGEKKLPRLAKRCIRSWKRFAPNFKIVQINENNFDVNLFVYTKQAAEQKKWAFVSDLARIKFLSENGGIYFDTDYELLKPIDDLLHYDFFTGYEDEKHIGFGFFGASRNNELLKKWLLDYQIRNFLVDEEVDLLTIGQSFERCFKIDDIKTERNCFFSETYFYPKNKEEIKNAFGIHYYEGSWLPLKIKFQKFIGPKLTKLIVSIKRFFAR